MQNNVPSNSNTTNAIPSWKKWLLGLFGVKNLEILDPVTYKHVYDAKDELCTKYGIKNTPNLYRSDDELATATHSIFGDIIITEGTLKLHGKPVEVGDINKIDDKLEFVLAHELSHASHNARDTLAISAIAVGVGGLFATAYNFLSSKISFLNEGFIGRACKTVIGTVGLIATSVIATAAYSRRSEQIADAEAIKHTGKPQALIDSFDSMLEHNSKIYAAKTNQGDQKNSPSPIIEKAKQVLLWPFNNQLTQQHPKMEDRYSFARAEISRMQSVAKPGNAL